MQFFKRLIVFILTLESRLILAKYRPFIIAVTGSVGKTSTKDAIYDVLKDHSEYVRKSDKSMNSDIGLPLTVIGVPNAWHSLRGWLDNMKSGLSLIFRKQEYPDCLILELGADHPGDIKKVAKWLHPDISVITRVSRTPVHVEFFKSAEQVFEEKMSLAYGTKKGGTVILFADDDKMMGEVDKLSARGLNVVTLGLNEKAAVKGSSSHIDYEDHGGRKEVVGFSFTVTIGNDAKELNIRDTVGSVAMYPLLAAAAVANVRHVPFPMIMKALGHFVAPKGRLRILEGVNDSIILDDTYNSSPDAARSGLETLRQIEISGRKIAMLGDMLELGKHSSEEHRKIGALAKEVVSMLITVGPRSKATAEEALKSGLASDMVKSFDLSDQAASYISSVVKAGDIILVKGSQSVRMERVVKALLKEPSKAAKLLVRQEREWLSKE